MIQNEERKYELSLDETAKSLNAMVYGYFQPPDLQYFMAKYDSFVKKIKPEEYELYFDCEYLRITLMDLLGMLTSCFEIFNADKFKKVLIKCGKHPNIKSQVKKAAETAKLSHYEIIETN
jgi:hypothetical protein